MNLEQYLKERKVDEIEDDEEFCDAEYDAAYDYCEEREFVLSDEDLGCLKARGLDESFDCWREGYEEEMCKEGRKQMDSYMEKVGEVYFGSTIDITDPCYDKNVWCRMNGVEIEPGCYSCYIRKDEDEDFYNGKLFYINGAIAIFKDDNIIDLDDMYALGEIGVDAGMAGFYTNKPDYSIEEWSEMCERWGNDNVEEVTENSFCANTGYGDGCYLVYAHENDYGRIDALEIVCN